MIWLIGWIIIEVGVYGSQTPDLAGTLRSHRASVVLGRWLHRCAYVLAALRLPFLLIPFLLKQLFFRCWPAPPRVWHSLIGQGVRLLGEAVHLWLAIILAQRLIEPAAWLAWPLLIAAGGEFVRLATQKGQMVASAGWQALPHRRLAGWLAARLPAGRPRFVARYCRYYQLDDDERFTALLQLLHRSAHYDQIVAERLQHLHGFRIVPDAHPLRSGLVRDVARGLVFVHRRWSNDPYLVIGQALRRTPWTFDPRILGRPFRYRTQGNHRMTSFVLRQGHWCLPYAIYQFGHEVKAAGYAILYCVARLAGYALEGAMPADGIFQFERGAPPSEALLWDEQLMLSDLRQRQADGEPLDPLVIAERYCYPLVYVTEVVVPSLLSQTPAQSPQRQLVARPTADNGRP